MFGFDSYLHLQYAKSIVDTGHINSTKIMESYTDFSGFHLFLASLSLVSGVSLSKIFKYCSVIIPIIIFDLTVLAFIRKSNKKNQVAQIETINIQYFSVILLFPSLIGLQMLFGRPNSLGLSLFIFVVYMYLCHSESFRMQILAGFLSVVVVKIHHLSGLFLLPILFYISVFYVSDYKTLLSMVYTIPAVFIMEIILNSREFQILRIYLSRIEFYQNLANITFYEIAILLILWVCLTFVGFYIRKNYGTKLIEKLNEKKWMIYAKVCFVSMLVVGELISITYYTVSLSSVYITIEMIVLFTLSGAALLKWEKIRYSLFILGLGFFFLTGILFLTISTIDHELVWIAPRTFVFTIIFIALLSYLAVSNFLFQLKRKMFTIFLMILVLNTSCSALYIGCEYLPNYNLYNRYSQITFAVWIYSNVNVSENSISLPFSVGKFIPGFDIYKSPIWFNQYSTRNENALRLLQFHTPYIAIGTNMDLWLSPSVHLDFEDIEYYINTNYADYPLFHLIYSSNDYFLLYRL